MAAETLTDSKTLKFESGKVNTKSKMKRKLRLKSQHYWCNQTIKTTILVDSNY